MPDFVDTAPPIGVTSVAHSLKSPAVFAAPSMVKQELVHVSPTASPVASPTTLSSASEPAVGLAQHEVEEQRCKKKQQVSASSFLALSQRNQKKIFAGSSTQVKESVAKKAMPTLASFFAPK